MTAQEAHREVQARRDRTAAEKAAAKLREDTAFALAQRTKSDAAMAKFDALLQEAIQAERFGFTLVRLDYEDYSSGPPWNELVLHRTQPWVQDVFAKIAAKGFTPSLVHDHDGIGMSAWFNLTVSF
jgi:hypothetical protein